MKRIIYKKIVVLYKSLLILTLVTTSVSLLSGAPVFADTDYEGEHGRPLEGVLQQIRDRQGLGPDQEINPRQVGDKDLEELGEAVMRIMHPDPQQHEFMDRMMGGEGSESLRRAHISMGYNYLASLDDENYGWFGRRGMMGNSMMGGGMMGHGMMGGYWRNPSMFFSFGGIIMWLLIIVIIGVVVYLIVRTQRSASGHDYISNRYETPLEIAKKRYARGEISGEEYKTIKQNL